MNSSRLETPADRFLSLCISHALSENWLTADAILAEFPPVALMTGLEPATALRSELLINAAGVHEKIAPKKSTAAAAEDLQIALEEAVCSPADIVELLSVDELVRHLDTQALWALLVRDEFWKANGNREQERMLFTLQTAMDQDLVNLPALLRSLTPQRLAADLPRELLEEALVHALNSGLDAAPFDPSELFNLISLETWLKHVSLLHVWDTALLEEIGPEAGFTAKTEKLQQEVEPAPVAQTPAAQTPATQSSNKSKPKAKGKLKNKAKAEPSAGAKEKPAPAPSPAEIKARDEALGRLKELERTPPRAAELQTPLLLAIDSMYAELLKLDSDEDRAECIEDAFPNETMLREALLVLAETLDPKVTAAELLEKGADTESMLSLVLFEERRRTPTTSGLSPSATPPALPNAGSVPPPPNSAVTSRPQASAPPPLPGEAVRRASTPPPPLPAQATRKR